MVDRSAINKLVIKQMATHIENVQSRYSNKTVTLTYITLIEESQCRQLVMVKSLIGESSHPVDFSATVKTPHS